jgi:hypothetical protein
VRILLEENLPEGLIEPLRLLGHAVDSVASLRLEGLDNGRLYREVASGYDLFFTKAPAAGGAVCHRLHGES